MTNGGQRVAIVTGASRGIGAEIARQFAGAGYAVCINYLKSEAEALKIAAETGGFPFRADVSDYTQSAEMVERVMREYGRIDVLVNNAGVACFGLFHDIPEETADRVFDVNVKGTLNCSKAVLPHMLRVHSGAVINISSIWGVTGASCEVHYSASKAAVIGFTKALAKEAAPSGIRVNCIAPGVIDTEMNGRLSFEEAEQLQAEIPLGRFGTCAEVAETALFLADSAGFITGQVIGVNGGA